MRAEDILKLVKTGSYGTPDAPIRSSSVKATFWATYFGYMDVSAYKGTVNYEAAKAGEAYKKTIIGG